MPRENFSRRVARAAAVGSGRAYRQQTPLTWYLTVLVIVLLGVSLVTYSRYERLHPQPAAVNKGTPPTASDEWQAAVAIDNCGTVSDTLLPASGPDEAFTNNGSGVVTIAPGNNPTDPAAYEGKNAVLGAYLTLDGVTLTGTLLSIPGKTVPVTTTTSSTTTTTLAGGKKGKSTTTTSSTTSSTTSTTSSTTTSTTLAKGSTGKSTTTSSSTTTTSSSSTTTTTVKTRTLPPTVFKSGSTCPAGTPDAGKKVVLEAETWPQPTSTQGGKVITSAVGQIAFANGQLITIAFVPKGSTIAQPPAAARTAVHDFLIENPTATAPSTTTSIPVTIPSTVPTSSSSTSTTKPSSSSSSSSTSSSTTSTTKP
ncbi:MAG TPA: hypothetical protein VGP46_00420 [Acidimicrobiales bacterium]|nr:hypothetical protein [Acidimicrobiales bacterium]